MKCRLSPCEVSSFWFIPSDRVLATTFESYARYAKSILKGSISNREVLKAYEAAGIILRCFLSPLPPLLVHFFRQNIGSNFRTFVSISPSLHGHLGMSQVRRFLLLTLLLEAMARIGLAYCRPTYLVLGVVCSNLHSSGGLLQYSTVRSIVLVDKRHTGTMSTK